MNELNKYANIVTTCVFGVHVKAQTHSALWLSSLMMGYISTGHLNQGFYFTVKLPWSAGETQLTPAYSESLHSMAERLLQALLALPPPDAFPHAFYIQTPRCIENGFIEWCLVPTIKLFSS